MINHRHYHENTKEITEYRAIDGNWVKHPEGYCSRYKGYLTKKQIAVHGCTKRHGGICGRFQTVKGESVKRMNQQQFYDKMISRMDKMAASLDKIARSLDAISKHIDEEEELKSMAAFLEDSGGDFWISVNDRMENKSKSIDKNE